MLHHVDGFFQLFREFLEFAISGEFTVITYGLPILNHLNHSPKMSPTRATKTTIIGCLLWTVLHLSPQPSMVEAYFPE